MTFFLSNKFVLVIDGERNFFAYNANVYSNIQIVVLCMSDRSSMFSVCTLSLKNMLRLFSEMWV